MKVSIIIFLYKRGLPKNLGEAVAGRLRGLSGVEVSVDHTAKEYSRVCHLKI